MPQPGTVWLITGGASGVGAATATLAVARGQRVAVADINLDGARAVCQRLGEGAVPISLDVRDPEQWERTLDDVWKRFGRLDILVNNAGLIHVGFTVDLPIEKLRHMVDVNVIGVVNGMRTAVPRFLAQSAGHVINIGSLAGFVPMPGQALYAGTKHAVRAFTHGCALELRRTPVRFTLVCPAAIDTPMLRQQIGSEAATLSFADAALTAEQVADAVWCAAQEQPSEILLPRARGEFLRIGGVFPGIVRRLLGGAEARGRKAIERRRREQESKT